ncbi:hypothetical protein PG995_015822 [Apiospora arundinis]|uniref:Killer toxin subunits alpha/beta n=1 Tax=Apiospora arundinis TaxID=335852 RepID=A0ABR2IE37_9PEZI
MKFYPLVLTGQLILAQASEILQAHDSQNQEIENGYGDHDICQGIYATPDETTASVLPNTPESIIDYHGPLSKRDPKRKSGGNEGGKGEGGSGGRPTTTAKKPAATTAEKNPATTTTEKKLEPTTEKKPESTTEKESTTTTITKEGTTLTTQKTPKANRKTDTTMSGKTTTKNETTKTSNKSGTTMSGTGKSGTATIAESSSTMTSSKSNSSNITSGKPTRSNSSKYITTSSASASSSSSSAACKPKKGAQGVKDGHVEKAALGDAESSLDCDKNPPTMHVTETKKPIGKYEKRIPQKCPKELAQACYHYSSVMKIHAATKSMTEFTCGETRSNYRLNAHKDLKATALTDWGVTAIAKRSSKHQHWWPWAQGWILRNGEKSLDGACERDEWPPAYFWPGDAYAKKNNMVQRVRLNPATHNGPAGGIFHGFCATNDAIIMKGSTTLEKKENVETVGAPDVKKARKGPDGTDTITSIVSVNTRHAVFKFEDWDNLPVDNIWYGLKENECWPSDLAKEDPGWALLTYDEFYETQHTNLKQYRELYTKPPPIQDLKDALKKYGGKPPRPFSKIKKEKYTKYGFNNKSRKLYHIPDEYVGVLPSLDFTLPLKKRQMSSNSTEDHIMMGIDDISSDEANGLELVDIEEMTIEDIHNTSDEDLQQMDDEHLDAWMARYMDLLRKQAETSSNTSPPVSDAKPTPAGQANPTAQPAAVGSLGFDDLPKPTAI